MKLVPISFKIPRGGSGVEFGYVIRRRKKKLGGNPLVEFSISQTIVRTMKWHHGCLVRLDADLTERIAAFTNISNRTTLARKVCIIPSGRGLIRVPYTPEVQALFPDTSEMTAMSTVELNSDHLAFNLPKQPPAPAP